jgi:hypothetical protein
MRGLVAQYDAGHEMSEYEPRLMIYEVERLQDMINGDEDE